MAAVATMRAGAGGGAASAEQTQQLDRQYEDIVVQSQNLEHYEKLFQQVLVDLENDDVLETFRTEYESLHNSFLKCHEGEKKLIKKCADLQSEINGCALKVRAAEELSQGDKHTIEQLKKEIKRAKERVAQSRENELTQSEKIKQLKLDIKVLDDDVKRAPATVLNQDGQIRDLMGAKLELQKILETEKSQLISLQHDLAHYNSRCDKANDEKRAQEAILASTRKGIELKMNGVSLQQEMRDKMEREQGQVRAELVNRNREYSECQQVVQALQDEVRVLEEETLALQEECGRYDKDEQTLKRQCQDKRQEFEDCKKSYKDLGNRIRAHEVELKTKEDELDYAHKEVMKQRRIVDGYHKRNLMLEEMRADGGRRRDALKFELEQLELQIASMAKLADTDQKQVEDLTRERDILNKNFLKAVSATQRQQEWLQIKENQRRNLDHQLRGYEHEAQRIRERTLQVTREGAQYANEAAAFEEQRMGVMDKVKSFRADTEGRQKEIAETEHKLRHQLAMLDAVISERNQFAKNFLVMRQEIGAMTQRELGTQSLIENLNAELKKKESRSVDEEEKVQKLNSEKDLHEKQIEKAKKATEKKQRMIAAYQEELLKLNEIIGEADAEKSKQKRDHLSVLNERDILGSQLIRRNDELAKLYENIRIQQSSLKKGELQYADRLRDIQQLNFRTEQLSYEFETMRAFASRLPELRLAINKARRELTQEQCRVRMLLDECDNPRNVHRFRMLQGSEPHTEELFHRVRNMQSELLKKNGELEEKDAQIADMERLYLELKAVVARQPGPEVAEQLSVYKHSLTKKTGQLKAMMESLRQFSEHVELYQGRYHEIRDEMKNLSTAYVSAMRDRDREEARSRRGGGLGGTNASQHSEFEEYVGYTAPPRPQTADEDDSPMAGGGAYAGAGAGAGAASGLPDLVSPNDHDEDAAAAAAGAGVGSDDDNEADAGGGGGGGDDDQDEAGEAEEVDDEELDEELDEEVAGGEAAVHDDENAAAVDDTGAGGGAAAGPAEEDPAAAASSE